MTRQLPFTSASRFFPRLGLLLALALAPACNGDGGAASATDGGTTDGTTTGTTGTTDTTGTSETTGTPEPTGTGTTALTTTDPTTAADPTTTTDTTAGPTATSDTTATTDATDTDTTDGTTDTTDGTTGTTGTTGDALSFEADVWPILQANCGCHAAGQGGLTMTNAQTAHNNLVDVPSVHEPNIDRVEPGDPDNSFLYQKITGTQDGISPANSQMPKTPGQAMSNNPLSAQDQALIHDWIAQGAVF